MTRKVFKFLILLIFLPSIAFAQTIPSGVAIDLDMLLVIFASMGGFLMALGAIIATVAFVWVAVAFLTAGGDSSKVKNAKGILKVALIGSFILFSVGIIITLIQGFATDPLNFFM